MQQDVIRRELLRERDEPGALNIDLISLIVTRCLTAGYDVTLAGTPDASRYGLALRAIIATHPTPAHVYYFALSLEETPRRHATKANATGYGAPELADWYVPDDLPTRPEEGILKVGESQDRHRGAHRRRSPADPCPPWKRAPPAPNRILRPDRCRASGPAGTGL
ncbi:kinase [Frankia sp. AgB1.9]|uniref:kinase n=1 Tax=unclassified Frankia TaxID=2632575 RepID=UPI0019311AA6|nr:MULTISPECIES: kinase [unclassified Frankia]MBL7493541.1 kinase [Frankia sp. AgW1.1]MBL7553467.1 kinase [Frankia sp. AgB1.9]MBL7622320.1 kinase [Frankia sp. AgB1.8]